MTKCICNSCAQKLEELASTYFNQAALHYTEWASLEDNNSRSSKKAKKAKNKIADAMISFFSTMDQIQDVEVLESDEISDDDLH